MNTILKIHLHSDYIKDGVPMQENHTIFEVSKETSDRIYFKSKSSNSRTYVDKCNLNKISGGIECIQIKDSDEYKVICNLSIYCNSKDKHHYQKLLRLQFIHLVNNMFKHVKSFNDSFAHSEILDKCNSYINQETESTIK